MKMLSFHCFLVETGTTAPCESLLLQIEVSYSYSRQYLFEGERLEVE